MHSVAWNCSGTKLASGSVDQTARIWQIEPHGHVSFLSLSFCFQLTFDAGKRLDFVIVAFFCPPSMISDGSTEVGNWML